MKRCAAQWGGPIPTLGSQPTGESARRVGWLAGAALALLLAPAVAVAQSVTDLASPAELRVCADPANLPFSNEKGEGFENRIADLLGHAMNVSVTYVWFPQVVGFVRNTLYAQRCDVVMGTVAGSDMMDTTNPYYHTGYMIVTRSDDDIAATSLSDPSLAVKRFGLIAATPPTDLLLRHGLMPQVTSYALTVDTRYDSPSHDMLHDLTDRKIDVALLWGPFAGYYIKRDSLPFHAAFLQAEGPVRLDYRIAMGVRPNEPAWRRRLNELIRTNQDAITGILVSYGVPLLDEQNRPIDPATVHTP